MRTVGTDADEYIYSSGERATLDGKGGNDALEGAAIYGDVFLFGANRRQ